MPDYKLLAGRVSRRQSEAASRHPPPPPPPPPQPEPYEDAAFGDASNTSHSTSAGGVFKNAAVQILQSERRLMSTGEITKIALERKLVKATGKTPENTMASALYTDVRKRGANSPFFKPKEGLFGLKAWLAEVWLREWLAKEGIPADEVPPELADTPATKRARINRHAKSIVSRSVTSAGQTDTDSDEKTSNLNLLLEAANEIEREDDRHEASAYGRGANGRHPGVADSRASKHMRSKKPPLRPSHHDHDAMPAHLPHPTLPYGAHPFLLKGVIPPMPPLSHNPSLPFMNYTMFNPLMAQQFFAANPAAAAAAAAGHLSIDPSRLGMLPLGMPFPGTSLLDPLGPLPPITPTISPSGTPSAYAPHPPPLHLELTGRSITSILRAASAREKENGPLPAKKDPINILNLPLPSFDTEDFGSSEDAPDCGEVAQQQHAAGSPHADSHPEKPCSPAGEGDASAATSERLLLAARGGGGDLEPAGLAGAEDDVEDAAGGAGRPSMEAAAAKLALRELKRVSEAAGSSSAKLQEHEKINLYRQHIQFLERSLGNMHPQVGKAYVFLGRALQHEGSRWSLTMAQRALLRAWQILASVKTRVDQEQPASLNDFSYLMGHLQETQAHQALQVQQLQLAGAAQAKLPPMVVFQPPGVQQQQQQQQ